MTRLKVTARRMGQAAIALTSIQLASCASAPPKVAPAPAVAAPPPPAAIVTMAPIPNPKEPPPHERRSEGHSRSESTPARHDHAKAAVEAPAAPAADPGRAAQLRARGLEELDRGAVTRAVALLAQASQLDPSNAVIRRDLDRAERIARAVHGSR